MLVATGLDLLAASRRDAAQAAAAARARAREEQRGALVRRATRANRQVVLVCDRISRKTTWRDGRGVARPHPEDLTDPGVWAREPDRCGCRACRTASVAVDGAGAPELTHLIDALTWTAAADADLAPLVAPRTRAAVARVAARAGDFLAAAERRAVVDFCGGGAPAGARRALLKLWVCSADAAAASDAVFAATFDEVADGDAAERLALARFAVARGLRRGLLLVTPTMWADDAVARALYDADARVARARAFVAATLRARLRRRGVDDAPFAATVAARVVDLLWPFDAYPAVADAAPAFRPAASRAIIAPPRRAPAPTYRLDDDADFPSL